MKTSGIYHIVNKVNGKYYVGSSNNVYHRWSRHRSQLNHNKYPNLHLQNAWNKYGVKNFSFILIAEIPVDLLLENEQKILSGLVLRDTYNISPAAIAPMAGRKHTAETKLKMSRSQSGHKVSTEQKRKISDARIGRFGGVNNPNYGKHHSLQTRMKMGTPDPMVFHFKNQSTSEEYIGIRRDFGLKYNIKKNSVWNLIHGKVKTCKGWICS